ncbi:MAG: hypothetical protein IPL47_03340 [Phyllobacteriaceae bacterium]|nr:hypothetical protein [Phyllobacteriaceae bacterium]
MNLAKALAIKLALDLGGFILSALAGSLVLNLAIIAASAADSDPDTAVLAAGLALSVPFTALFVGYFAAVPAFFVIVAAELFRLRQPWFFLAAGSGIALLVVYLIRSAGGEAEAGPGLFATLLLAGAAAGLAYWVVAGRSSGDWRIVTSPG